MSLGYNKNSKHEQSESFWTSYSDLFLGLSSIFLMLYVVASLRTGTNGMQATAENQKLKIQVQDLKNQLQTYESVKENYMQNKAAKSELEEYNELMDKLSLLQQDAKDEKDKLTQQAKANGQKELALNKYQQMVRNVINSSKFSKVKIENRNEVITEKENVIVEKDVEIQEQDTKITSLNQDINQKQRMIAQKESQIAQTNDALNQKMKELRYSYNHAKMTQKAYNNRLKKLKEEAQEQVEALNDQKMQTVAQLQNAKKELGQLSGQLTQVSGQLDQTKGQLNTTKGQLEAKAQEAAALQDKLGQSEVETKEKIAALKGEFEAGRGRERAAFEAELRKQKGLGAAEIARREGEFRKAGEAKERALAGQIAAAKAAGEAKERMLAGQLDEAKREGEAKANALSGKIAGLAGQLKETEGELSKTRAELAARQKIAGDIKKGFDKAGIKADIDMKSGDVVIDFGQAYFDNDSSALKKQMRDVLQKAMPVYSKSLFGNKDVSSNISAVEVIGFASPTYKGRFVDPSSNKKEDIEALKYNMDLSYRRARSIFNYILDEDQIKFQYQNNLVPMLKVSGRSFLETMKINRNVASATDFCKQNDCKKTQRVIIRFNMDKKK